MAEPELAPNDCSLQDEDLNKRLSAMTRAQRINHFRSSFTKAQRLQDMAVPQEVFTAHPHFRNDILDAYLKFTTFTAKAWVNYDTACKQFFTDQRLDDCGKLMLEASNLSKLEEAIIGGREIYRFRLEVGTPFETLCWITFRLNKPNPLPTINTIYQPQTGAHPRLMEFMSNLCDYFNGLGLLKADDAFMFHHLTCFASHLRRAPTDAEIEDKQRGYRSIWMDLSRDWENEGWTDLDALERHKRRGG